MLCKCLNVPRSVYYYHQNHKTNSYHESNKILDTEIKSIYDDSKGRYGSPKITVVLKEKGLKITQKRISRRMRVLGLRSIVAKKWKAYGASQNQASKEYPNLLEQDFKTNVPGLKWVGDITYIYTKEQGWTYLATVMDLFDLKIIGWEYGKSMTDELAIKALQKATKNRKMNDEIIYHSDRGSQYTSNNYELKLKELGIIHSYSKKGYPYDNACMESFNSILKKELVNHKEYLSFNEAKMSLFEFIEGWYHNKRIHSSLNYQTPNQVFNNYVVSIQEKSLSFCVQ